MAYVLVLTAAPDAGLSDDAVSAISATFAETGPTRRLSDSAVEMSMATAELPAAARDAAEAARVDVNVVPAANRRKRLLIADMDSTMIPVECIDEVADFAGVREQVVAITEPAMRGEMSFEEALRARVALMKGLDASRLQDVYDQRVTLNPGARTAVQTMRAHGAYTALVSGGFTFFTERVAAAAGFDENRANQLLVEDGMLTGSVAEPVLGRAAKVEALGEMIDRLDLSAVETLAVGDGANDLGMIDAAGLGAAFRAKPVVADAADVRIQFGDLTALLYLQGYNEAEFVAD